MQELVGHQSQTIAEAVVAEIKQFVHNHIAEGDDDGLGLSGCGSGPSGQPDSEATLRAKLDRAEAIWNKPEGCC